MTMACPTLHLKGGAKIETMLNAIDCNSQAVVAEAYGKLFGTSGYLGTALTAALTIYLAFFAMQIMTGRSSLSLPKLMPRIFMLGGVLTVATSWPAYYQLIYGLLTGGPDELASSLLGESHATQRFAGIMQQLYEHILSASVSLAELKVTSGNQASNIATAGDLLWLSGVMMLFGTTGVLAIAKIMLTLLLALGPFFAVFAIFSATRGIAEGWLRTSVLFSLIPLIVTLLGRAALVALAPLISSLKWTGGASGDPVSSVLMLFAGTLIYLSLLAIAVKTAVSLTRGWQPLGNLVVGTSSVKTSAGSAPTAPQSIRPLDGPAANLPNENSAGEVTHQVVAALTRGQSSQATHTPTTDHHRTVVMQPRALSNTLSPKTKRTATPITRRSHLRTYRPLSGVVGR